MLGLACIIHTMLVWCFSFLLCLRKTLRSRSITICGVILWNGLEQELKQSTSIIQFKRMYRNTFLENYENEERWLKMRNYCVCINVNVSRNNLHNDLKDNHWSSKGWELISICFLLLPFGQIWFFKIIIINMKTFFCWIYKYYHECG